MVRLHDVQIPGLSVTFNGEVRTLEEADELMKSGFGGVMMGRALIDDPYKLAFVDCRHVASQTREAVALVYAEWLEHGCNASANADSANMHPMLNLFHGHPKNKLWKRLLLEDRQAPTAQRVRWALDQLA